MGNCVSSYRPHDPGHNYYEPGVYLITLVTRGRRPLLGSLNDDIKAPGVVLSEVGKAVMDCWTDIPERQLKHGRKVIVHSAICMPDHVHGVIEVIERTDVSVGEVIRGFKAGCTMAWHKIQRPSMVAGNDVHPNMDEQQEREILKRLSKRQRAEYYAEHPEALQPLFDDNYDDTICINEEHRQRMLRYVDDNPRRAIIRRLRPDFMQRRLHVVIGGRDYAAFGNLFLLRWARKVQVFCHRKAPDGKTPYEQTETYRQECREWKRQVMEGATVIVTPGISKGELLIKNRCLESGYPLIHLQKEPIGEYWKPEASRFEACCQGSLLILAPWASDQLGDVRGVPQTTDYSIFHNLNTLAEEICKFDGEARVSFK